MATKIVTKNSSTGGSAPSASDLVQGELAVNVTDKRLYTENNAGAIVELGTNPASAVTMASTLAVTGNVDFNGDLDVDGTTNLDVVDIDGAVDMASTLQVDGALTVSGATNALSPIAVRNATQSFFGGLSAEVNTSILNFGLNEGSANRFGGAYTQANQGGMIHFDTRSGEPLFQLYGRAAGAAGATGTLFFQIDSTGNTVFNETGVDADFRVESDGNANALFVDGGNNSVGLFAGAADTVNASLAIGLTGVVVAGNTDGATIGKASTVRLVNSNNYSSTNAGVFLLGGGTSGSVGGISSGLGFFRENSGNWGTQLRFYTHPTSTSDIDALNEAMRITAAGHLYLGSTSQLSAAKFLVSFDGTTENAYVARTTRSGLNSNFAYFLNSLNQAAGSITHTGSTTVSYNTSSDYRLKEDDQLMTGATERVKALRPINFAWKVDGSRVDGFFAHEAQAVVPECVTGTKDAMRDEEYEVTAAVEEVRDEDDNVTTEAAEAVMGTRSVPDMQGIDQSKLVPLLVAALQEAIARIEALEGA